MVLRASKIMGRKTEQAEQWFDKLADTMIREKLNFVQAAQREGLPLTNEECDKYAKRKEFQRALRSARNRYYAELANDPTRTKNVLLGQMMYALQELMHAGEYKDAVDAALKLARVEGFIGPEQEVNVFGGLSAKEFETVRELIQKRAKELIERTPKVSAVDTSKLD